MRIPVERDGKTITLNSYSLLQDRFFEGMSAAGFDGFERGDFKSTREHLSVTEYKVQQEQKRLEKAEKQAEKKEAQLEKLDAKIAVKQTKAATLAEIDAMGHPLPLVPGVHFSGDEAKRLKALARQTAKTDERIAKSKRDMAAVKTQLAETEQKLRDVSTERDHWHREWQGLWNEVKPFIEAIRKFPQKLKEFIATLFPQVHSREKEQEIAPPQIQSTKKKSHGIGGR
jgi:myosin heavy subunit